PVCPGSRRNGLQRVQTRAAIQIPSGGGCPWQARENRLASAAGNHHDSEGMSNGAAPGTLWIAGEDEPAPNTPLPHFSGRPPPANEAMEALSSRAMRIA